MTVPPPPFYRFRPHPWHGLDAGVEAPRVVNAYIEITQMSSGSPSPRFEAGESAATRSAQ